MYDDIEVDCFELGCLHCDKPTLPGEPYCSQSCRLAEIDCTMSNVHSHDHDHNIDSARSSFSDSSRSMTGFYLPPAINFGSYRRSSVKPRQSSPTTPPKLSPSSSRSSLKNELSEQAQKELLYYTNAFDRSRELKRRMTQ